jgi:hypothetical protein
MTAMNRYWLMICVGLVAAVLMLLNASSSGVRAQGNAEPKAYPRYNVISAPSGLLYYINMYNGKVWQATPSNRLGAKDYQWAEINTPNPKD